MGSSTPEPSDREQTLTHRRIAPLLALAVALTPFSLDAYLPAFPAIAAALRTTTSETGLTLSIYVFLLAVGQLVGGPLSDRLGRRPVVFAGLAIFVAGCLLVMASQTLPWMMVARAVQAFGGGWVAVSVPAMVRDRSSGAESARLFSLISLIMFLAPALAPSVGSLLLAGVGWRGIFGFLAVYAVLVGALLELLLFRGAAADALPPKQPLRALVTNYRHVLTHGTAMMLIVLRALVFSVLLMYLTNAPFLLQDWLGLPNSGFSAVFALNVSCMAGLAALNRFLVGRFEPERILGVAVRFQTVAVALLLAVTLWSPARWLLIPALMMIVGAMGAIAPNIQASVMQHFRVLGGTAAAVMGAVQFAGGGIVSGLSALTVQGHASRVGVAMLVCSCAASLLVVAVRRRLDSLPVDARTAV